MLKFPCHFLSTRNALAIAFSLTSYLLTSCGKAVVFGTLAQRPKASTLAPLQVYLDRDGSIYPFDGPPINDAVLGRKRTGQGYLLRYYNNTPADLAAVYAAHSITAPPDTLEGWPTLQRKLRAEAAIKINGQLDKLGVNSTLIVLIHGFNNTAAEAHASYAEVEKQLIATGLPKGAYQVLEVYWDGRHAAIPFFFRYAQPNAQFAGLALRGIINQISPTHPIRILTHSLGTLVGCNVLWNVVTTMGGQGVTTVEDSNLKFWQTIRTRRADSTTQARYYYQQACRDIMDYSTPTHPDIRLGSIAAAVPGQTYADYLDRTPSLQSTDGLYRRVVISYNPTDKVLNKFWVFAPLNRYFGITTLGRRNYDYVHYVEPMLNTSSTGGKSYQVKFYHQKKGQFNHSLVGYAKAAEMPCFLNLLFSSDGAGSPAPCPP
jgi:hypothetical protein